MSTAFLTWITTYVLIVLAELGDKTQVAVLLFTSSNPGKRWTILAASALALVCCVAIEVTVGVTVARYVGPHLINRFAGVVFLLIGVLTLVRTLEVSVKVRIKGAEGSACEQPGII
jgi:putative Ca2+/H+ antiporter (TMEM165/GDT1 family)